MLDETNNLNNKSNDSRNTSFMSGSQTNVLQVKPAPDSANLSSTPKSKKKNLKQWLTNLSKKQKILLSLCVILLIAIVAGTVWYAFLRPEPVAPEPVPAVVEAPPETTEASRLTGIKYPLEDKVNERTVTGVMIENSPDARPQSGLRDAGVVYEAVAEGGITRFLALFQDTAPTYVGPVRSVRPYYLDFLGPYNAAIAHVGGSGEALAQIRDQKIKDLDQFSNPGPYWRERTRYAPHNMYTNIKELKKLEKQKGWKPSEYTGLERGAESKAAATPTATTIDVKMSSMLYNVSYKYDKKTNTYLRSEGNRPHMDAKSNKQLAPAVVVVPIIERSQNGIYSVYKVNGSGKVLVFQNGTVAEGTWSKKSRTSQFQLKTKDGEVLKLAPGQTWFTIAATNANVSYK
jgi:hypothetical protein